jgi:hypothetical protein
MAIVTSRTVVAHRARIPPDSMVLRIEPFDADRIMCWLDSWRARNKELFLANPQLELTTEQAGRLSALCEQPLLLLMLALYVGDGNEIPEGSSDRLAAADGAIYERLLTAFARREVLKERTGADPEQLESLVQAELELLSIAAFAMFNRSAQYVAEADLNDDLLALTAGSAVRGGPGRRPTPAQMLVGRFFFVHVSRAHFGDNTEGHIRTYEFLHATFGEFLVARAAVRVLRSIADRRSADYRMPSTMRPPIDDSLALALLSFQNLAQRRQVITFAQQELRNLSGSAQAELRATLLELLATAFSTAPGDRYTRYAPTWLGLTERIANYTANLLILLVCLDESVPLAKLFLGATDPTREWTKAARLWHSQMDTEAWLSLVDVLDFDSRSGRVKMRHTTDTVDSPSSGDRLAGLYNGSVLLNDSQLSSILASVLPIADHGEVMFDRGSGSVSPARNLLDLLPLSENLRDRGKPESRFRVGLQQVPHLPMASRERYLLTVTQLLAARNDSLVDLPALLRICEVAVDALAACPNASLAAIYQFVLAARKVIRGRPALRPRCVALIRELLTGTTSSSSAPGRYGLRIILVVNDLLEPAEVPDGWQEPERAALVEDDWADGDGDTVHRLFRVCRRRERPGWQGQLGPVILDRLPDVLLDWIDELDLEYALAGADGEQADVLRQRCRAQRCR